MKTIQDKKIYINVARAKSVKEYMIQILSNKLMYKQSTYFDKELTKLECSLGKNRSISSLYNVVKTEYPSTTLEKFLGIYGELIFNLEIKDNSDNVIAMFYCNDIHKFIIIRYEKSNYQHNKNNLFRISTSSLWRYKNYPEEERCVDGFTVELLTKLMKYNELHKI